MHVKMFFFRFFFLWVYYYDYLYVFYMLDIGQRTFELMFPVYRHTDENNNDLSTASAAVERGSRTT